MSTLPFRGQTLDHGGYTKKPADLGLLPRFSGLIQTVGTTGFEPATP
jgi:hypothetical protein